MAKQKTWREAVVELLPELPVRFRLEELYRFAPALHAQFPHNHHVSEKLRQVLQELRNDGAIRFVDNDGTYENLKNPGPPTRILGLFAGQLLTRKELADMLEMAGVAGLQRGIVTRTTGPFRGNIFLFHDEKENPYGDVIEGSRVRYVGQGTEGDQELKDRNRTLAEHLDRRMKVHYFVQPRDRPGQIRYEGEVVVQHVRRLYREEEKRSVLEYALVPAPNGQSLDSYGQVYSEILTDTRPLELEPRVREMVAYYRVLRNWAFREIVLRAYQRNCAVCGAPIQRENLLELDGAHIVPVVDRGPDRVENGMSLCKRHHWAFDNGIFTVEDDLQVRWLLSTPDPHGEVQTGQGLLGPLLDENRPAPKFLGIHRKKWGA